MSIFNPQFNIATNQYSFYQQSVVQKIPEEEEDGQSKKKNELITTILTDEDFSDQDKRYQLLYYYIPYEDLKIFLSKYKASTIKNIKNFLTAYHKLEIKTIAFEQGVSTEWTDEDKYIAVNLIIKSNFKITPKIFLEGNLVANKTIFQCENLINYQKRFLKSGKTINDIISFQNISSDNKQILNKKINKFITAYFANNNSFKFLTKEKNFNVTFSTNIPRMPHSIEEKTQKTIEEKSCSDIDFQETDFLSFCLFDDTQQ